MSFDDLQPAKPASQSTNENIPSVISLSDIFTQDLDDLDLGSGDEDDKEGNTEDPKVCLSSVLMTFKVFFTWNIKL